MTVNTSRECCVPFSLKEFFFSCSGNRAADNKYYVEEEERKQKTEKVSRSAAPNLPVRDRSSFNSSTQQQQRTLKKRKTSQVTTSDSTPPPSNRRTFSKTPRALKPTRKKVSAASSHMTPIPQVDSSISPDTMIMGHVVNSHYMTSQTASTSLSPIPSSPTSINSTGFVVLDRPRTPAEEEEGARLSL